MTDKNSYLTVYYDGSCPLCRAEISVYRRGLGAESLELVDVSTLDDGALTLGLEKTSAMKRFHVRSKDGTLFSGAEAFGQLWSILPRWRWLGRIVLLPGVLQASEAAYRCFLVVRPGLQRIWRARSSTDDPR